MLKMIIKVLKWVVDFFFYTEVVGEFQYNENVFKGQLWKDNSSNTKTLVPEIGFKKPNPYGLRAMLQCRNTSSATPVEIDSIKPVPQIYEFTPSSGLSELLKNRNKAPKPKRNLTKMVIGNHKVSWKQFKENNQQVNTFFTKPIH